MRKNFLIHNFDSKIANDVALNTPSQVCTVCPHDEIQVCTVCPHDEIQVCTVFPHDEIAPILMMQQPVATLERIRILPFTQKPYAIKETDGKATAQVVFSEQKEVVSRLAKKFWPGPLTVYLRTDDKCSLPSQSADGMTYVGVSNPSHPLTNRLLKEAASEERVVVAIPSLRSAQYMTKAADVCSHYASQFCTDKDKHAIHVLNGEDKRELFSVPTCQYEKPCNYSLWIDDSCRTVYIRGIQDDTLTARHVLRAILSAAPTQDERLKNRNRVITAVLRKWKVVDRRSASSSTAGDL